MAPKRVPPPPSGQAPVSQEVVQIVKKKLAAPSGRPPAGMENFKMPKHLSPMLSPRKKSNDDDDDEIDDDSPYNRKYNNTYNDDNKRPNKTRYNDNDDNNDYISDEGWNRDNNNNDNNSNNNTNNRRRHNKSSAYDNDRGPGIKAREQDEDAISFDADSRDNNQRKLIDNKQVNNAAKSTNNNEKKKLMIFNFAPILKATYRDLKAYITGSCPENFITRCYIERNRNGSNMLTPFYSLCADLEDGTGRELAVCRKVLLSSSSYYVFSLKSEDLYKKREMRSRLYLGKLRANSSNEYILYDNGIERTSEHGVSDDEDDGKDSGDKKSDPSENNNFRKELCCIYFNTKSRPSPPAVRGMEVCIPYVDNSTTSSSQKQPSTIRQPFSRIREDGTQNTFMKNKYYLLNERTSKYDPLSSCLVDFKGRANVASVKNFQLVESTPNQAVTTDMIQTDFDKEYILQMGKTTEDCFNMDFKHPLSVLQAFAICVARFDAKLSW